MLDLSTVQTLVSLSVPLVAFVASLLAHYVYAHLSPAAKKNVEDLANLAVPAVEQACSLMSGDAKKAEAMRMIGVLGAAFGVKVDPMIASIAIEAAVHALRQVNVPATPTLIMPVVNP